MAVVKFALVGFLNTAVGLVIVMTALALDFNDFAANALGYGLGLVVSYCLNRYWTFAAKAPPSLNELTLFGCAFAIAYSANLLVLAAFRAEGFIDQPLAHFSGLAVYSALFYALSRNVVFGEGRRGAA